MNRQTCLKKIFKLSDQHHHTLDIEQSAIYIADRYGEYSKEMAYISTILAAKLHKRGYYHLQKAAYKLDFNLIDLERLVLIKLNYELYHDGFISYVGFFAKKPLSIDFLIISRYLSWYDVKASYNTIILAIQIMKKSLFKFTKVYRLFLLVSEKYDINLKDLIIQYNNLV